MSADDDAGAPLDEPALVPELLVTDPALSRAFWCGPCGFAVRQDRPAQGFAYLVRGGAHVMLEQVGVGRNWVSGPLEVPLGRGVSFQVAVDDVEPVLAALRAADLPLFMEPEERWYALGGGGGGGGVGGVAEVGVRQFVVADPDGYLLRFQAHVGERPVSKAPHGRR